MKQGTIPGRRSFLRLLSLTAAAPALPSARAMTARFPVRDDMELEVTTTIKRVKPPWPMIEDALHRIDEGYATRQPIISETYAILSLPENTYVQTLRGVQGFHLEWRITGAHYDDYVHYRAAYPGGSSREAALKTRDGVDDGQERDFVRIKDAVDAFRAFFLGESPPCWLHWRVLDI